MKKRRNYQQRPEYYTLIPKDSDDDKYGEFIEFIPPSGARCVAVGLGCSGWRETNRTDERREKHVKLLPSTCVKTYDEFRIEFRQNCGNPFYFHGNNFCYGIGTLGGDSGAPVVCRHPGEKGTASTWEGRTVYSIAVRLTEVNMNQG